MTGTPTQTQPSTLARRRQLELATATLAGLTAANAVGGAVYGLRGAPGVPRAWLQRSPFRDYRIPSAILGIAVGGSAAGAAATAWRGSDHAPVTAVAAGTVLTGWIVAQVAVIGLRSALQPAMAAVGIGLIGLGRRLACDEREAPGPGVLDRGRAAACGH